MKILFTSVGRRVSLFRRPESGKDLGKDLTIIGGDFSDTAPALYFCDKTKKLCKLRIHITSRLYWKFAKKKRWTA